MNARPGRTFAAIRAALSILALAAGPVAAGAAVVEATIRGGSLVAPQRTLVVTQHSELELRWRSDRPIDLHLHGYGLQVRVTPQQPATLAFKARLAGRFPVSEHGADGRDHRVVGYLEVHP